MSALRFATIGAGFWAGYQVAGWWELEGAECVAVCNRTRSKAEQLARRFGVPGVYDDAAEMLDRERPDFVDVVTAVETHDGFVRLAAERGVPVICQKPMGRTLAEAEGMVAACRAAGVPLLVHENWRWQAPIRQLKRILDEGRIGTPFRARIDFVSGFPVFENQPFLRDAEQFILADLGSHILDVARFLFGEAESLHCLTDRIHADIAGEDVASVTLRMGGSTTVVCAMSYAGTPLERERFPETFLFVEGDRGSLELGPDYWVRLTNEEGTLAKRYPPPFHAWADPAYALVHASIVPCNADLLRALRGEGAAETTGEDNLRTARLVFAAYDSAARGEAVRLSPDAPSALWE